MTENESQVELFPSDETTLQDIVELRIVFVNISDTDSMTLEVHVLGCIKGKSVDCKKWKFSNNAFCGLFYFTQFRVFFVASRGSIRYRPSTV